MIQLGSDDFWRGSTGLVLIVFIEDLDKNLI